MMIRAGMHLVFSNTADMSHRNGAIIAVAAAAAAATTTTTTTTTFFF